MKFHAARKQPTTENAAALQNTVNKCTTTALNVRISNKQTNCDTGDESKLGTSLKYIFYDGVIASHARRKSTEINIASARMYI